jgi:hypothetical protein
MMISTQQEAVTTMSAKERSFTDRDILCGRGGKVNRHPGNRVYRRLVEHKKNLYKNLIRKEDKYMLICSILHAVKSEGGRFMKEDEITGTWFEIGDDEAMGKMSQAFREPEKKSQVETVTTSRPQRFKSVTPSTSRENESLDFRLSSSSSSNASLHQQQEQQRPLVLEAPGLSVTWQDNITDDCAPLPLHTSMKCAPFPAGRKRNSPLLAAAQRPKSLRRLSPQREDSSEIFNFMKSIGGETGVDLTSSSQQSQDSFLFMGSISIGETDIFQSQNHSDEFLRCMRSISIGERAAAVATKQEEEDAVFRSEQDRLEFLRLMRQVSGDTHFKNAAPSLAQSPLMRQDSIDIWAGIMAGIPSSLHDNIPTEAV